MRVVIDRDRMVFLPIKHPDLNVVTNLAFVECAGYQAIHVMALDHTFAKGLTDLEKMMLYKNTTGQTCLRAGQGLVNVLMELAERIPEREVNAVELEVIAMSLPELRSERYTYIQGMKTAMRQSDIFLLDGVKVPKSDTESAIAVRAAVQAPVPEYVPPLPSAAAATRAPRAPLPSGPRRGGAKDIIWAAADKLWEAAGKPTDPAEVLKLRKEMMNVLETESGIKKTTSSNELGNWMKARLTK